MDSNKYWIGIRDSEVKFVKNFFKDSITIFGSKKGNNQIQPLNLAIFKNLDHNNVKNDKTIIDYQKKNMYEISKYNPNAKFMFYNQMIAVKYYPNNPNIICVNQKCLLDQLENKIQMREYFKNKIPVLKHYILSGNEINLANLNLIFKSEDNNGYVIQTAKGAGGSGTIVFYDDKQKKFFEENDKYLVTQYCKESLSINIHLVISKEKVIIFPGSIQIIENQNNHLVYKGCDFIGYNKISPSLKNKANDYAKIIGKDLQKQGYLGICGIDLLLFKDEVYFIEINSRFQNSSMVLNKALLENHYNSLQEMNYKSFYNLNIDYKPIKVNYSCYICDYGQQNNIPSIMPIQTLDYSNSNVIFEKNSYLKTLVYDKSIYNNSTVIAIKDDIKH